MARRPTHPAARLLAPAAVFTAILGLAACYPKGWRVAEPGLGERAEAPFDAGPYLVRTGPGRVAVVVQHGLDAPPIVELAQVATGSAAPRWAPREMEERDGLWVGEWTGLPVESPHQYRVRSAAGDVGPHVFRVGRARGERFRFAAFGDTRTGHRVHRALIESMAREAVDFVVHSGDLVEFGGVEEQWQLFFRIERPVIARAPLMAAIGNHDESRRGLFRRYFLLNDWAGGRRYAFHDWGDVRVVLVDSEIKLRRGSAQYEFIEAALAEGAARDQLMVMSLHYPPYSSGSHGSNPEVAEVLDEIAPRFGVELVLAGHDHNYERTKKINGVTYMVAASGGANIRPVSPHDFTEVLRTEPHYVLFDVDRGALVGRSVNLAGDVFDSFILEPLPPSGAPSP